MSATHDSATVRTARRNQTDPTVRKIARALQSRRSTNVRTISNGIIKADEVNIGPTTLRRIGQRFDCRIGVTFYDTDEMIHFHLHGV